MQLDSQINIDDKKSEQKDRFSEEIVDGSVDDDKNLIDLNDESDDEVDENIGLSESSLVQLEDKDGVHGRGFSNPGPAWQQIMAQIDSKHSMDSLYWAMYPAIGFII